ncbi:MAG: hypothetical protein ACI9YB_003504, partial [Halioglobus sp.]
YFLLHGFPRKLKSPEALIGSSCRTHEGVAYSTKSL